MISAQDASQSSQTKGYDAKKQICSKCIGFLMHKHATSPEQRMVVCPNCGVLWVRADNRPVWGQTTLNPSILIVLSRGRA